MRARVGFWVHRCEGATGYVAPGGYVWGHDSCFPARLGGRNCTAGGRYAAFTSPGSHPYLIE
eukprot:4156864-Pleurochrysis_carterae.AAC.1